MVLIYPVCIPLILAMWVMTPTCILPYFSFIISFAVFSQLLKSCPFYHLGFLPVWTYPWSLRVVSLLPGSFIISFAVFSQLLKPLSILYYQYDLVRDHCGAPLFFIPLYPGVYMSMFLWICSTAQELWVSVVSGDVRFSGGRPRRMQSFVGIGARLCPTRYICVDVICSHDIVNRVRWPCNPLGWSYLWPDASADADVSWLIIVAIRFVLHEPVTAVLELCFVGTMSTTGYSTN